MGDIYLFLANKLIEIVRDERRGDEFIFYHSEQTGDYGFCYKRGYSGLMAKPARTGASAGKVKPRQGLFDIEILTGTRHHGKVTHRNLFEDLLDHSDLEHCHAVWRGDDPRDIGRTQDETDTLVAMCLLMFEQEVNWGTEEWQRGSNFPPAQRSPTKRRPRDMIMGFVKYSFDLGKENLDDLKWWMQVKPGTVTFQSPGPTGPKYFRQHPERHYFDELLDDDVAEALMVELSRQLFREVAQGLPYNPQYSDVDIKER